MILINSSPKNALKIFQPFLPIYIPIGIGCLATHAKKNGVRTLVVDEQVEDDAFALIQTNIKNFKKPYIFGFSVLTAGLKSALALAAKLKRNYPDSINIFGGIHPTAMPDEIMQFNCVDYVVRGEGEINIVNLYNAIKNGDDISSIPSLSFRKDGKIVHNPISCVHDNEYINYPFPYHLFAKNKHKYDFGFVISSRGCPYECIFCSNRVTTGKRYYFKSPEVIIDELNTLYHKYNQRHIQFLDDNFLVNKERVYVLLEYIRKSSLDKKMVFNFQSRGDNTDYKLMEELYRTGFKNVFFGLETASEEIMKTIKKGETVAQCIDAVNMAKKIGFHVSATFIYGLPGDTHKDRMDCVRLCKDLKLDLVRFNNATPYPGTELYDIAKNTKRLYVQGMYENFNSVSTFIENPFKKIPFSYVPENNTEEEIRGDILYSYFKYYMDINKIRAIFEKPEQNEGWFNAGEKVTEVVAKIPSLCVLGFMMFIKYIQLFYFRYMKKTIGSFVERLR
ncbi:MAG: radical SAM protein [Candidatus Ancaeobacter aquaticus]|nr:radical SAM protein [Candidatus Ancaeobacter aquaticus]